MLRLPVAVREEARTRLNLLIGDIKDVSVYQSAARQADCAVLLACAWSGSDCHAVNVEGTLNVVNCLKGSAQVIYASSAALVTADGLVGKEVLRAEEQLGKSPRARAPFLPLGASEYLRTKATALAALSSIPTLQPRLTVVYPSLVLGPRSRSAARRTVEVSL
jgi:nucleoside-diphosphate-sugar epimerase